MTARQSDGQTVVHAWVLLQDEKKDTLDEVISRVNALLESKQQIFSYQKWSTKDFPRLRTRKVDRAAVNRINSPMQSTSQKEQMGQENLTNLSSILRSLAAKKTIKDNDALGEDLKLDSLRRIQLVAMIEQYIGIPFNELNITAQTTVKDLQQMLSQQPSTSPTSSHTVHTVEEITEHWKFSPLVRKLRVFLQNCLLFPIHSHFVKLNVQGNLSPLSTHKQFIFIVNHPGIFDLVCAMRLMPHNVREKMALMATEERWEDGNTFIQLLIEVVMGGYPIGRKGAWMNVGLEATGELVDQGYSILMAPEGEMERTGKPRTFLVGLGYMAKELDLPIYMFKINIDQYQRIWPAPKPDEQATDSGYYWPRDKGTVDLKIGQATVASSLNTDELTKDIEKQFWNL